MSSRYVDIFLEAHPGPLWLCYFCGDAVDDLLVHHINGDHYDDCLENLAPAHRPCHVSYHLKGKPKSDEHREKIRQTRIGTTMPDETRQKISDAHRGKPKSDETKRRMSEAQRGHFVSDEARKNMRHAAIGRKASDEARQNMSKAMQGRIISDAHREALSASLKGVPRAFKQHVCECGMVCHGGPMSNHIRATGHKRVAILEPDGKKIDA